MTLNLLTPGGAGLNDGPGSWLAIERYVDAYEEESTRGRASIESHLPAAVDPLYVPVLTELVRVDMERSWRRRETPRLEDYRRRFPQLAERREAWGEIAYEEYRLRHQAGEHPTTGEYAAQGIDVASWPVHQELDGEVDLPESGGQFAGFTLVAELGRGAFARVFLAKQPELADRLVVLKVSRESFDESGTLAQLRHPQIVPVHSVHHLGELHAVCMPFLGSVTLADILASLRGRPSWPERGAELLASVAAGPACLGAMRRAARQDQEASQATAGGYVDAVLWLCRKLADGLDHAHRLGVVHQDLKPANVLVADDGQPLLLDFNLSAELLGPASRNRAVVGGTLPYMAPEQIVALDQPECGAAPDPRSDLFSLGVVLFELLTGQRPFAARDRSAPLALSASDRLAAPPSASSVNPQVPRAVDAIVRRLLAPELSDRYQAASEVVEDLTRQLRHQPLRFAPDRSWRERVAKWARRHPRASSSAAVGVAALVLLAGVSLGAWRLATALRTHEALESFRNFSLERRGALYRLHNALSVDVARRDEGIALATEALAPWGEATWDGADGGEWHESPLARRLPAAERERLRAEALELAALIAPAGTEAAEQLLHNDKFMEGRALALAGRYVEALDVLTARVRKRETAQDFWSWFVIGRCYDELGRQRDAITAYDACIVLWPEFAPAYYNRGVAQLRLGQHAAALADLDEAVRHEPGMAEAWINRGLCRLAIADPRGAAEDLTEALKLRPGDSRVLLMRGRAREAAGDAEGAEQDRLAGLAATPADAPGWVARGMASWSSDPARALDDFDEALRLDPRYLPALQNRAALLSQRPEGLEDAVRALDRVIEAYPDYVAARSSRAVLLARLGRRREAHSDARTALSMDGSLATKYQVAGAFALTSPGRPEDRAEAFRLLRAAVSQGYGVELLRVDEDLAPLRGELEFDELLRVADDWLATRAAGTRHEASEPPSEPPISEAPNPPQNGGPAQEEKHE